MKTKWGNAKICNEGYYKITSKKEGNCNKLLHRLIATDYFGDWINDPEEPFDIHHIDGNKLNNCVLNLEPIPHDEHIRLHQKNKIMAEETKRKISEFRKGISFSDEHKRNISEAKKGKHYSNETCMNMSKSRNSTGYFRVTKVKSKTCKQGFTWMYQYYEGGKRKSIYSVDIEKLEAKVKSKGLIWKKLEVNEK